ncbi:MAG: rod shape-determining protein MreD [Actinomycetota bacterium]
MRWLRYFLLILSLVVVQTALFPSLQIWDAAPDLLLVATIAVAYERGAETGAVFGFCSGIAVDCFLASPLGVSALAFSIVGYGVGVFQSGLVRSTRWMAPVLGGLGGLVGGTLWVVIASIVGSESLFDARTLRVVLLASLYDAVVALAIFPFARWASGEHEYARR